MYEIIARVADISQARVLIAALQAHGFHPMEGGESGVAGMPGVFSPRGIPISVPDDEANDCKLLAEALLKDMAAR